MRRITLFLLVLVMLSCGKNKPEPNILPPTKAKLIFPAKDEACISGKFVSDSQSSINFMWEKADNADSYELNIKNLTSNKMLTINVADNTKDVVLDKSTPYSWYVIAKSLKSDEKPVSETWRFYNSGPGASNYIPYPAEAVSPKMGETVVATANRVTLQWTALDLDNDIKSYTLYLDTDPNPSLFKENYTTNSVKDIYLYSNTVYYWKIITIDFMGNSSESIVYKFTVR